MNKKVQTKNPRKLRNVVYPMRDKRIMRDLNQKVPNIDSVFFELPFFKVTKKPMRPKKDMAIPDQKPINPGPGAENIPWPYLSEHKDTVIPNPKKKIDEH